MADRVTVDVGGLRQEIKAIYSDNPLWEELLLSQKLRRLIQERLKLKRRVARLISSASIKGSAILARKALRIKDDENSQLYSHSS